MTTPRPFSPRVLSRGELALWRTGQGIALLALLALGIGAAVAPGVTLPLFWNLVLPLVPATLLIDPDLWRGVCPLATLSIGPRPAKAPLATEATVWLGAGAIGLFLVLMPARRFLLNEHAGAVVATVIGTAGAAIMLGRRGDQKAGFCNTLCPILPVERLYGQSPLVRAKNPRCAVCTHCTLLGCLDLAPAKAHAQMLGSVRRSGPWTRTAVGAFGAMFPGLVVGYGILPNTPFSGVGILISYATILGLGVASWGIVTVLTHRAQVAPRTVLLLLGALSLALYYWFAAPGAAAVVNGGGMVVMGIRIGAIGLAVVWLVVARRRDAGLAGWTSGP